MPIRRNISGWHLPVVDRIGQTVCPSLYVFSLYILTAIFPSEPGLTSFIGAKDNGSGGDKWSYKMCKALVK